MLLRTYQPSFLSYAGPIIYSFHSLTFTINNMAGATEEFPPVEGGGSLILAWQIRNKKVLIVGGGEVSSVLRTTPIVHWN